MVRLSHVFGRRRVAAVEELALDGAQRLADVRRLRWKAGDALTRAAWGVEGSTLESTPQLANGQSVGAAEIRDTLNAERRSTAGRRARGQTSGREQRAAGLAQQRGGPLACQGRHCKGVVVELEPMEIRTFRVQLEAPSGSGLNS